MLLMNYLNGERFSESHPMKLKKKLPKLIMERCLIKKVLDFSITFAMLFMGVPNVLIAVKHHSARYFHH